MCIEDHGDTHGPSQPLKSICLNGGSRQCVMLMRMGNWNKGFRGSRESSVLDLQVFADVLNVLFN